MNPIQNKYLMQYDPNKTILPSFNLKLIGPWDEQESETIQYKNYHRMYPLTLTPTHQKKSIKQFPLISIRKHSHKVKPIRRQSNHKIRHNTQMIQPKEVDIFSSVKSESICSSNNSPSKSQFKLSQKPSKIDSQRFRKFKVSSKFGNRWIHMNKDTAKETLVVDIKNWKRVNTLEVQTNDSYNFISRKRTIM